MKKLSILLFSALLLVLAGPAMAKKPKAAILHCGCDLAGTDMEYTYKEVSLKSKGHESHSAIDSCWDGDVTYTDVMRTGIDCNVNLVGGLSYLTHCDLMPLTPLAGDDCGAPPPEAP